MDKIDAGGWAVIIGAIFLGFTQIVSLILQHLARKTANKIHTLVNSNMGVQLEISAVSLRRNATATKDPEDIRVAELAEAALKNHQVQQRIVDKGMDPPK